MKRQKKYTPLLFTTTVRNPQRTKGLLNILSHFNGECLTKDLAVTIMGELIRYGLYRPMRKRLSVKRKWSDTKSGEFSTVLLNDSEVKYMLRNNPQAHKEAGFEKGWASRFATIFDFAKELGFVYFWTDTEIIFSEIGLKLANSITVQVVDNGVIMVSDSHPEFEQQVFLHALAKSQRNNPFVRALNENVPLILLLEVIQKLNEDEEYNGAGISKLEIPLILFWKDNNSEEVYKLIKSIRQQYGYSPSYEVIIDICVNDIMQGEFKSFKPKSIMVEYPDEFIRKMRLTGLISLRGQGRFIDVNHNAQETVDYVLKTYSKYDKYETEKEYFDYMAQVDENLISQVTSPIDVEENNKYLTKWIEIYSFDKIKDELNVLAKKRLSKDDVLKYLSSPVRLEFLTSLAIKSKFPNVDVLPNYPCDDEGIPTSTAGGRGDQGDIECQEDGNGVLIEVTMSEGRSQTVMEVWPITRHLERFSPRFKNSMCYFIAPSIYRDSERQIAYIKSVENLYIYPSTIEAFLVLLENSSQLYKEC